MSKIYSLESFVRPESKSLVATNGCFDLLHWGHCDFIQRARKLGDFLVVGVNSDFSVWTLKGVGRPIIEEMDRAQLVAALRWVDAVVLFPQTRATDFLKAVKPNIWVKGGDYSLDTLDQSERAAVADCGGKTMILSTLPGRSTTDIIKACMIA